MKYYSQMILNFTIKDYQGNKYDDYHYPDWANTVGWCITFSSVVCIPIVGLFKIARAEGSLWARISQLTTVRCQDIIETVIRFSQKYCNLYIVARNANKCDKREKYFFVTMIVNSPDWGPKMPPTAGPEEGESSTTFILYCSIYQFSPVFPKQR